VSFHTDVDGELNLPAGCEVVENAPRLWLLKVSGPLGPLVNVLGKLPVQDMQVEEARLEDVVLKIYREGKP
jgi:ABC-type uncharacterized transport system ATPase subunit